MRQHLAAEESPFTSDLVLASIKVLIQGLQIQYRKQLLCSLDTHCQCHWWVVERGLRMEIGSCVVEIASFDSICSRAVVALRQIVSESLPIFAFVLMHPSFDT